MSAVDLLEPILENGLQRNNFFNGRLLSAEDLRAEQEATRTQVAAVARAVGDGVSWGLSVRPLSTVQGRRRVEVSAGLALNRYGNLLALNEDTELTLVPEQKPPSAGAGLFGSCEPPRAGVTVVGEGAYVLTIAPASGYSGTALVSDPNSTAAGRGSCGARYTVEGVRFRLVQIEFERLERAGSPLRSRIPALLAQSGTPARERARNLLAHACYGTDELPDYFTAPAKQDAEFRPYWRYWGILDAMLARQDLRWCDVPLAIIVFSTTAIRFVDTWSVRRRLFSEAAIDRWYAVGGPRRLAEAEASFLQFQSQVDAIRGESAIARPTVAAATYFDVLPAAGWLPVGANEFSWQTFLGSHAPATVTQVDAALLRGIIQRSWFLDPFRLDTAPPVPLHVYQVPNANFVVFARSERGNIRVVLSPATAAGATATATASTGQVTRSGGSAAGAVTIADLAPGAYTVEVAANGFVSASITAVPVVGGRTVERAATLTPNPSGVIMVTVVDRETQADIGRQATRVVAEQGGQLFHGQMQTNGKWRIADLPAQTYTVSARVPGYEDASAASVLATASAERAVTLRAARLPTPTGKQPSRCIETLLRRPAVGRVRFCMVLDSIEFDQRWYYRNQKEPEQSWIGNDTYRVKGRKNTRKVKTRYSSEEGYLLYGEQPWSGFQPLDSLPGGVDNWLLAWRDWFAQDLGDRSIQAAEPAIYIDLHYQVPNTIARVPETPRAYAVFGQFGVPLQVAPLDSATRADVPIEEHVDWRGMRKDLLEKYRKHGIDHVNDLAFTWAERLEDIGEEVVNPVRHQIINAVEGAAKVNEARTYLEGMDTQTKQVLEQNNIKDDVALANADPKQLAQLLGSESFATGLIYQARGIVPKESWSLEALGFTADAAHKAAERGIDSMGVLASKMTSEEGRSAVADALDVKANSAEAVKGTLDSLELGAITAMTQYSIAGAPERTVASLGSIDAVSASRIAAADIVTADELATMDAAVLAEKAGITVAVAERAVSEAKTVSATAIEIGSVAGAGAVAGTSAIGSKTAGAVVSMPETDVANEVGNAAVAGAVIAGINAGLAARIGGMRR